VQFIRKKKEILRAYYFRVHMIRTYGV